MASALEVTRTVPALPEYYASPCQYVYLPNLVTNIPGLTSAQVNSCFFFKLRFSTIEDDLIVHLMSYNIKIIGHAPEEELDPLENWKSVENGFFIDGSISNWQERKALALAAFWCKTCRNGCAHNKFKTHFTKHYLSVFLTALSAVAVFFGSQKAMDSIVNLQFALDVSDVHLPSRRSIL